MPGLLFRVVLLQDDAVLLPARLLFLVTPKLAAGAKLGHHVQVIGSLVLLQVVLTLHLHRQLEDMVACIIPQVAMSASLA